MLCSVCNTKNADNALSCQACGSPLAESEPIAFSAVLPAGTKLQGGVYSIGKRLGQGGFGITYLGSDVTLRRAVAIKEYFPIGCIRQGCTVQPSGTLSAAVFQQDKTKFIEEARALARFQHPGIVHVHTSFEENNTAYMVMEYLKGKSLQSVIDERGALSEHEAVGTIQKLGEALSVVHQAGWLHRDIKPDNIMLSEEGRVVLIDFGTAREFTSGKTKNMTQQFTVIYCAPEQRLSEAKFGAYTDVYALSSTLYHLLTGQAPIPSFDRAMGVDLPPPHRINTSVSRIVSDAVLWAMELKTDKRPQSVGDFLKALQGATSPPTPSRKSKAAARSTPISPETANPYQSRIELLFGELAQPVPPPPPSAHDYRIDEISRRLNALTQHTFGKFAQCPACRKANMNRVLGQADGTCPVCRNARLTQLKWDETLCPVCRTGKIVEHTLNSPMFCAICCLSPVQEDRRKLLGMTLETRYKCPHCNANYEAVRGERAKLVSYTSDPYGNGAKYIQQPLQFVQWQRLAGRSSDYMTCNHCDAQFDNEAMQRPRRAKLVYATSDPYGIVAKL